MGGVGPKSVPPTRAASHPSPGPVASIGFHSIARPRTRCSSSGSSGGRSGPASGSARRSCRSSRPPGHARSGCLRTSCSGGSWCKWRYRGPRRAPRSIGAGRIVGESEPCRRGYRSKPSHRCTPWPCQRRSRGGEGKRRALPPVPVNGGNRGSGVTSCRAHRRRAWCSATTAAPAPAGATAAPAGATAAPAGATAGHRDRHRSVRAITIMVASRAAPEADY